MNLIPFETITYSTKLSEEEVIRRLTNFIDCEKTFRFDLFDSGPKKLYEGENNGQQFTMKRILGFRFSTYKPVVPEISGKIQQANDKITIQVDMKLHPFEDAFLYVLIGGCGFTGIAMLLILITDHKFSTLCLTFLGMFLLIYISIVWSFTFECGKSKKHLKELIEGEIITENNLSS